ncbi:MAG: RES family NAD+ phosphorylase [Verrucomicrobia bacterium]|nr:RES family NAD+ phosphorylase [Verrucomicrobiota bacterium]
MSNSAPGKVVFWRITRDKYDKVADAFSGAGAAQYPGRWNGVGVPVVYAACSIALGVLELLVHTKSRSALNERFVLFKGLADPDLVFKPDLPAKLPKSESRRIGNEWVQRASHPILEVPSIITGEPNYLLNPNHSAFEKIEIGDSELFRFDPRILERLK